MTFPESKTQRKQSVKKPTAILCVTGSELTRGETHDLNGPFLGTNLTALGVHVQEIRVIPDDDDLLAQTFSEAMKRVDITIVSGGLGPTADDCTVRVLAETVGSQVVRDPTAEARMLERARNRRPGMPVPKNYVKQAEVVEGSKVLLNPVGLAPGCLLETERGFIVVLPGVPFEMREMYRQLVEPEISERFRLSPPRIFRAKILGHGESWVEERIQALGFDFSRFEYGISARPGEIMIKCIAHAGKDHSYVDEVVSKLETEFGNDLLVLEEGLFDAQGKPREVSHARLVHELLLESGKTLATSESCTGGLVAKLITDNPGSSSYFLGSIVAYSNTIKENLLNVDAETLSSQGAVSEDVCRQLALGAKKKFGADYGVGITGIAGPDGGSDEKPVGLVYVGVAYPDDAEEAVRVERHLFWGQRTNVRTLSAVRTLDLIRRDLEARGVQSRASS